MLLFRTGLFPWTNKGGVFLLPADVIVENNGEIKFIIGSVIFNSIGNCLGWSFDIEQKALEKAYNKKYINSHPLTFDCYINKSFLIDFLNLYKSPLA